MTEGVPGSDPEPTVLGGGSDTIKDMIVAVAQPLIYLLIPPLYLYRSRPILVRLWKWRWVYIAFLLGAALVSAPQVLNGGPPTALILTPVFHLFVAGVVIVLIIGAVPGLSMSSDVLPLSVALVVIVAAMSAVVAFVLAFRSSWGSSDVDADAVSLDADDDEYAVPMTEVWKSGGKND